MLILEERCAFQRHRAANVHVGRFNVLLAETEMVQQVEGHVGQLLVGNLQRVLEEVCAKRPLVEDELDVEGALESSVDSFDLLVGEALCLQRTGVDARSLVQVTVANCVSLDLGDLAFGVTERTQCIGNSAVDDLEITATGKLLELYQREVRLDAGRVAIHDEADRAGRRDNGGLGVAVAVLFAKLEGLVPGSGCMGDEVLVRAICVDQRNRVHRQAFITVSQALRCTAVVTDDAQHVVAVRCKARERTKLTRHFSRGRIGNTGHDRGQSPGNRTALVAVIRNARRHQQAADVGVAEAECAVLVGEFGNLAGRELRHHDRNFENDRPQTNRMFVIGNVDVLGGGILELNKVQRSKIAGRIVEEHVFRARVGCADRAGSRAGVPVVHGRVEVQAGICRCPCGMRNLFPQVARLQGLHDLAVAACRQIPVAVVFNCAQEVILQ